MFTIRSSFQLIPYKTTLFTQDPDCPSPASLFLITAARSANIWRPHSSIFNNVENKTSKLSRVWAILRRCACFFCDPLKRTELFFFIKLIRHNIEISVGGSNLESCQQNTECRLSNQQYNKLYQKLADTS